MKYENLKYTIPYKNAPTYCLKMKIERIELLCDKIAEGDLDSDDLNHIRQILRETQYCLTNLYKERKEALK